MFSREPRHTSLENQYYHPSPAEYQDITRPAPPFRISPHPTPVKPAVQAVLQKRADLPTNIGPGSYEVTPQPSLQQKHRVQRNKQSIKRELYVIKKEHTPDGKNETQLVLEKFQPQVEKFSLDHLGPGYYNPDLKQVRPQASSALMQDHSQEPNYVQMNLQQTDLFNQQMREMLLNQKVAKQERAMQPRPVLASLEGHKQKMNKEVKQQQALNEDKKVLFSIIKHQQEDQLYQKFKNNKQKQLALMQSQSRKKQSRFQSASSLSLGPGAYHPDKYHEYYSQGQKAAVDKAERFNHRYHQEQNDASMPGPGRYSSVGMAQLIKNNRTSQEHAFGSGSLRELARDVDTSQPGPGHYQMKGQFQRKKKQKYCMVQLPERVKPHHKARQNSLDLDQNINLRQSYEVEKVVQSHAVFRDQQPRFANPSPDTTHRFLEPTQSLCKPSFSLQANKCDKATKMSVFDQPKDNLPLLGPGTYI